MVVVDLLGKDFMNNFKRSTCDSHRPKKLKALRAFYLYPELLPMRITGIFFVRNTSAYQSYKELNYAMV